MPRIPSHTEIVKKAKGREPLKVFILKRDILVYLDKTINSKEIRATIKLSHADTK